MLFRLFEPTNPASAGPASVDPSIRARLIAAVLAVVIPAVTFWLMAAVWFWHQSKADAERELLIRARALATVVQRELGQTEATLRALATSPYLATGDLAGFHRQAVPLARHEGTRIGLSDASGQMLVNTLFPFGTPLAKRGDFSVVEQVFVTGKRQVSNLYIGPLTREPLVAVDVPVMLSGKVAYDLNMALRAANFATPLQEQAPAGEGWVLGIFDGRGAFVARVPDSARFAGKLGTAAAQAVVHGTRPEGTYRSPGADGHPTLSAYARVAGTPWTAFVGRRESVFNAALAELLTRIGLGALALLAVGMAAAMIQTQRIARSVHALERTAALLGAGAPVLPDAGQAAGVREVGEVHAALVEAAARLARRAAQRDAAERLLRESNQRKDEFLAMLAHELRNPLAPLTNAHRLLDRTQRLDAAGRSMLGMAQRQTRQLTRLVDDLLEISRVSRGRIALQCEAMSATTAVGHAVESLAPAIEARGQTLRTAVPDRPVQIMADPARVAQILENLLTNASKYTPEGGTIRVELEERPEEVEIRVIDDGIGIEPAKIPQLFELFHQIDATLDRSAGGLGIGLSLVKRLVELHGGSVQASSAGLGKGATFTVRLPRTLSQACSTRGLPVFAPP